MSKKHHSKSSRTLGLLWALITTFSVTIADSEAVAAEWIFDGEVVRLQDNPREAISMSDPFDINFIRELFPSHQVEEIEEEGDAIVVKSKRGRLVIGGWDSKIYYIRGVDGDFKDVLGNRIGDSLLTTIGAPTAICEWGESPFCQSNIASTLYYVVELCVPSDFPIDRGTYTLKQCDRIGGFHLVSK